MKGRKRKRTKKKTKMKMSTTMTGRMKFPDATVDDFEQEMSW